MQRLDVRAYNPFLFVSVDKINMCKPGFKSIKDEFLLQRCFMICDKDWLVILILEAFLK